MEGVGDEREAIEAKRELNVEEWSNIDTHREVGRSHTLSLSLFQASFSEKEIILYITSPQHHHYSPYSTKTPPGLTLPSLIAVRLLSAKEDIHSPTHTTALFFIPLQSSSSPTVVSPSLHHPPAGPPSPLCVYYLSPPFAKLLPTTTRNLPQLWESNVNPHNLLRWFHLMFPQYLFFFYGDKVLCSHFCRVRLQAHFWSVWKSFIVPLLLRMKLLYRLFHYN